MPTQLINGVGYELYSPQWREAMAKQSASPTSSAAMTSLLSPAEQVGQSNTEAARKQSAEQAERDRQLATTAETNRTTQAAADLKARQESDARRDALTATGQTNTNNQAMASLTAQKETDARNAALATTHETNTVAQADADRKAKQDADARAAQLTATGMSNDMARAQADREAVAVREAKAQSAHTGDITLSATLADKNAAAASARSQAAREAMLGRIPSLMSSLTGDVDASGPSGAPTANGPDPAQAARETAFARAKEKIGEVQRGAMTALREGLSGRGIEAGSGIESDAMASLIGEGEGQLSDVVTGQMGAEAERANRVADQRRAEALTKRGQNIGLGQSMLSLWGSSAY